MKKTMKTISHPSANTLSLVLIPIPVIILIRVIFHWNMSDTAWILSVVIPMLVYLGLLNYFCIKQKCHKQLVLSNISSLIAIASFIAIVLI